MFGEYNVLRGLFELGWEGSLLTGLLYDQVYCQ